MQDFFVRKYWKEEDVLFYLHFKGDEAVRQIEVSDRGKIFLSLDNPIKGESILYDQSINDLDLHADDFITKQEFEKIWQDGAVR
jgi:hypothetical protein